MTVVHKLSQLYPAPQWAFFEQVRSGTGEVGDLRIADGIAVNLWPSKGWDIVYFEEKASKGDLRLEIKRPEKSKLARFCSRSYFVVRAPRKHVIPNLDVLPRGWGLYEVGAGPIVTVREAEKREPEEPDLDFIRALLRAGSSRGEAAVADLAGAPMKTITRPDLSRSRVGLSCSHTAPRPLDKKLPDKIRCFACQDNDPTDFDVVEAIIGDAKDEDLLRLSAMLNQALRLRGHHETGGVA